MTAHIDADALLHAVAHQMHDELARQGVHLDATLVDKAAEAALGAAYGDAKAVELVHRLGTENPQLAAVLGTAFAFLKSHPGFWVGFYALRHHEQPLHPEHPWSETIERGFGRSEGLHRHEHGRRLEEHHEWHPHHAAGYRPAAPNFGHTYAHGPRPRRPPPPPPVPHPQGWTPPQQQQQAWTPPAPQQQQPWTPPAPQTPDPSAYDPSTTAPPATDPAAFDPATLAAMYAPAPAPAVDPTVAIPAPAPDLSTDVSTAGYHHHQQHHHHPHHHQEQQQDAPDDQYTAGALGPHHLKRTIDSWLATLRATPLPWGVTQAQRTFLIQQLFALALSPTSATAQAVLAQLGQAAAGPEAQTYYGVLWQMLSRAPLAAVSVGYEHPGEIRPTADHRTDEHERLAQESAQHAAWQREQHGQPWRPPPAHELARPTWGGHPAAPSWGRPGMPHPGAPGRLNSYERWKEVHPNLSRADYDGWWAQHGQFGATIEPDAPVMMGMPGIGVTFTAGYHGHGARTAPPRGRRGGPEWWHGWEPYMGPEYDIDQRNELEDVASYSGPEEPEQMYAD